MGFEKNVGKKVEFHIIQKDSKGNDKYIPYTGTILYSNRTKTGYVIRGISTKGLYNRNKSDIVILDTEQELGVQVIDCTKSEMMVVA